MKIETIIDKVSKWLFWTGIIAGTIYFFYMVHRTYENYQYIKKANETETIQPYHGDDKFKKWLNV